MTRPIRNQKIIKLQKSKRLPCAICGDDIDYDAPAHSPLAFEADHIIPFSRGGGDTLANLQSTHAKCNNSKGDYFSPAEKKFADVKFYL